MPARNYVALVEKTIRLLEAFAGEQEVPLARLARQTGLVKSSAFRILFTLESLGYVERKPGGLYSLSPQIDTLAAKTRAAPDLGSLAAPFMAVVLRKFQETVNLGVLDNGEVLYIRVLESSHPFRIAAHAGIRSPVHSTALGKCLVAQLPRKEVDEILGRRPLNRITPRTICRRTDFYAELERVRQRGYAIDNEEDSRGARCLAAPIREPGGQPIAAMSISGPATRVTRAMEEPMVAALRDVCSQVSRLYAYTVGTPQIVARGNG